MTPIQKKEKAKAPLQSPGTETLPGFSFAERCLAQMRELFRKDPKRPDCRMAFLWDVAFCDLWRARIAKVARVELPHNRAQFGDFDTIDQMRLRGAWMEIRAAVVMFDDAADRWSREHPVDHYARARGRE
jgi:hypothetical protein